MRTNGFESASCSKSSYWVPKSAFAFPTVVVTATYSPLGEMFRVWRLFAFANVLKAARDSGAGWTNDLTSSVHPRAGSAGAREARKQRTCREPLPELSIAGGADRHEFVVEAIDVVGRKADAELDRLVFRCRTATGEPIGRCGPSVVQHERRGGAHHHREESKELGPDLHCAQVKIELAWTAPLWRQRAFYTLRRR